MYFIDRNKLEQYLLYMDGILQQVQHHQFETLIEKMGLERMAQVIVESMIDVGNMMIDGFIMRDPGSYEDIIDILVDEKVLPNEESNGYKEIFQLRKMLVQQYMDVNHDQLLETLKRNDSSLEMFSTRIRKYLKEELGPVSAFSNTELEEEK
ncbi:uncharacterized protein YutE (UPF0331/DUF86 family) [Salirhabdus euzebyi]|uniref:Uncharacterized protein YutE (UPF0331/DUF86 family) n=1 Tax=Salirhabdus euzebyi TaxID=394506 RepID=A0A841Q509_9BACI|nr:DUF86 domain-containing protein [Salirhabdus euzebyi]MBB6453443.1 uncharacterized protein YutE (UPF0331/DUF86 family) [Salirhabdus euzebyi]